MDLTETVQKVLADVLGHDERCKQPKAMLSDDLGADLLDLWEIMLELETQFGITIAEEEIERAILVRDVVALVERKVSDGSASRSKVA